MNGLCTYKKSTELGLNQTGVPLAKTLTRTFDVPQPETTIETGAQIISHYQPQHNLPLGLFTNDIPAPFAIPEPAGRTGFSR